MLRKIKHIIGFLISTIRSASVYPGCYLTLSVLLTFSCFEAPPASADARTVRVGVYEDAPKVFTSESGKPSGIFIEIIEHIAKIEGWTLRYVPGTWAQGLDRCAKGEIDLMPDVAYTVGSGKDLLLSQDSGPDRLVPGICKKRERDKIDNRLERKASCRPGEFAFNWKPSPGSRTVSG